MPCYRVVHCVRERYGLLGLLGVIRMTNPDLNTLALGTDLTTMGLDLNSPDCLFTTFASPWADAPAAQSRQFNLPACYMQSQPSLKTSHLNKFQLETLFHIFYSMPKDILQAYAAQELYNREWRYHRDMRLWFTEARQPDNSVSAECCATRCLTLRTIAPPHKNVLPHLSSHDCTTPLRGRHGTSRIALPLLPPHPFPHVQHSIHDCLDLRVDAMMNQVCH